MHGAGLQKGFSAKPPSRQGARMDGRFVAAIVGGLVVRPGTACSLKTSNRPSLTENLRFGSKHSIFVVGGEAQAIDIPCILSERTLRRRVCKV
jgi:hypothetical protein